MPFALYGITDRRAIVSANANNANTSSQNTTVKYCSHICMISNSLSLCVMNHVPVVVVVIFYYLK